VPLSADALFAVYSHRYLPSVSLMPRTHPFISTGAFRKAFSIGVDPQRIVSCFSFPSTVMCSGTHGITQIHKSSLGREVTSTLCSRGAFADIQFPMDRLQNSPTQQSASLNSKRMLKFFIPFVLRFAV